MSLEYPASIRASSSVDCSVCGGCHEGNGNDVDQNLGEHQAPRDWEQRPAIADGNEALAKAEKAGDNGREDEETTKAELNWPPAHPQPV
jgi:hypothetical protein